MGSLEYVAAIGIRLCSNVDGRLPVAKATLKCPSCNGEVELGDIECKHCGLNLKSGESYGSRVKQAKGKAVHPEHFGGAIYVGVVLAFCLVVFAGYMYQRTVEKTIMTKPELFVYPVQKMQEVADLAAVALQEPKGSEERAENLNAARKRGEELIQWIKFQADSVKPPEAYHPDTQRYSYGMRQEPEYNKWVAKRLLRNLSVKAEKLVKSLPTA